MSATRPCSLGPGIWIMTQLHSGNAEKFVCSKATFYLHYNPFQLYTIRLPPQFLQLKSSKETRVGEDELSERRQLEFLYGLLLFTFLMNLPCEIVHTEYEPSWEIWPNSPTIPVVFAFMNRYNTCLKYVSYIVLSTHATSYRHNEDVMNAKQTRIRNFCRKYFMALCPYPVLRLT